MGGTRKRTFEQWVYRRRIDIGRWLKNHNIGSIEDLNLWCNNAGLKCPNDKTIQEYFAKPGPTLPQTRKKKTKSRLKKTTPVVHKSSSDEDEVWHTPAAERPRKKRKFAKLKEDGDKEDDS